MSSFWARRVGSAVHSPLWSPGRSRRVSRSVPSFGPSPGRPSNYNNSEDSPSASPPVRESPPRTARLQGIKAGKSSPRAAHRVYGSARRRSLRNRNSARTHSFPPLPKWFINDNVLLFQNNNAAADEKFTSGVIVAGTEEGPQVCFPATIPKSCQNPPEPASTNSHPTLPSAISLVEFRNAITASLNLCSPASLSPNFRPHILVQFPLLGGCEMIDLSLQVIASSLGADIVTIDAQDLADLLGGNNTWSNDLSFKTYVNTDATPVESPSIEESPHEYNDSSLTQSIEFANWPSWPRPKPRNLAVVSIPSSLASEITKQFKDAGSLSSLAQFIRCDSDSTPGGMEKSPVGKLSGSNLLSTEHLTQLAEQLLDAPKLLRSGSSPDPPESARAEPPSEFQTSLNPIDLMPPTISSRFSIHFHPDAILSRSPSIQPAMILHIRDIQRLCAAPIGEIVVKALIDSIKRRRASPLTQRIVLVGSSYPSRNSGKRDKEEEFLRKIEQNSETLEFRSIMMIPHSEFSQSRRSRSTPHEESDSSDVWDSLERQRISQINIRNYHRVARTVLPVSRCNLRLHRGLTLSNIDPIVYKKISRQVLTQSQIQQIVMITLGMFGLSCAPDLAHLSSAMSLLHVFDSAKDQWRRELLTGHDTSSTEAYAHYSRIKSLQKICNKHEQRLLPGVVDPSGLNTTFSRVHAPAATVDALRTSTSLALSRPDAFKYGVLASEALTGALLYGPPGVGKTLLARAVAKESGATMLEISAGEVNDMYVGEGEKNVRAVFSLARKLSPCVVFVDEADALLASRSSGIMGGHSQRTAHRDVINQFLKEWDGLHPSRQIFVVLATNRPFDLDDAVLRRLPIKLRVDLPNQEDRESILKIHLRDEKIESAVKIEEIAKRTADYSGSDLKNICVAAAIAAVKEEDEKGGPKPGETRTIADRHFEKAMKEINPSVSDDMESLKGLKKFDEQYGERRQRSKPVWGFERPEIPEKQS